MLSFVCFVQQRRLQRVIGTIAGMQHEVGATSGLTLYIFDIYAVVVCKSGEVQFTPAMGAVKT